jgi:hypothetical protein
MLLLIIYFQRPFFPAEAMKKQMSSTQIGIIFGIFQLVLLIFSPFFGKYVKKKKYKWHGLIQNNIYIFIYL